MKVLVIGKSAREQAFVEQIANSNRATKIFCVPGNPAIATFAECVNISAEDITGMVEFAKENEIDLTIALDEYVIQSGITDIFRHSGLKIFAPISEAAQIGTSRAFAKKLMYKAKVPTPKYGIFDKATSATDYLNNVKFPIIIKYDHLAHQDSFICTSFNKAKTLIENIFDDGQKRVVVEEFSEGEHFTFSILTDGYNVLPMPYTKEYKRNLSGDGGVLTKGVGAYTPFSKITSQQENFIAQKIVFPILDALQNMGAAYEGFLSINLLLLKNGEIKALEFLPTLSIPESTCILQLLNDDLLDVIYAASEGALEDCYQNLDFSEDAVCSVALMSGNYPNNPKLNSVVENIEELNEDGIELYYNDAGMNSYYEVVTTGGRAFFMTSRATTLSRAARNLYDNAEIIKFDGKNYRKDIAKSFVSKDYV